MTEEEKYWGCTPVVTEHMEAMLKASREYAKMMSNNGETPTQRASRARDFQCGAIWEEGYSNGGWHPANEPPECAEEVIILFKHGAYHDYPLIPMRFKYLGKWFMDVKWWCYPPKEDKK